MVQEQDWVTPLNGASPVVLSDADRTAPNGLVLVNGSNTVITKTAETIQIDLGLTVPLVGSSVNNAIKSKVLDFPIVQGQAQANGTTNKQLFVVNRACTITQISIAAAVTPVGGTNTVQVLKNGSTTLLSTSTFDPTTITANFTGQALALTSTTSNLNLVAGDTILVEYVSGSQSTAAQAVTVAIELEETDF